MIVYKKILLFTVTIVMLLSMTTNDANAQNLISIHSVQNITQMNTLSPGAGSILFVEDENANYQYNGSSWTQIGDASVAVSDTAGLGGLESTLETFITTIDNCPECNPVFEIGDTLECGVVVYVEPNGRSGLICALNDLANMAFGCPSNNPPVAIQGSSRVDGLNNSNLLNASCNTSAATSCLNYNACGSGWYLPARNELRFIRRNILIINNTLISIGETPLETNNSFYWSSTEIVGTPGNAAAVYMGDSFTTQSSFFWENDVFYNQYYGMPYTSENKTSIGKIRPVKRFFYE